jgi:hypothetical protein
MRGDGGEGGRGVAGSQPMSKALAHPVTWSPKNFGRSTSILDLWYIHFTYTGTGLTKYRNISSKTVRNLRMILT